LNKDFGFINTISQNLNLTIRREKYTKKQRKNSTETPNYTCPNPTCGKTFTKPLKVENLSSGTTMIYEACPYCLTEIATEEPEIKQEEAVSTNQLQPLVEASNCKHYFGYLSERSSRNAPPEECMVCPKIVQCMLKGITV